MDEWMNHRDALFERAVRRGRVLQWRRRLLSSAAVVAVVGLGVGVLATRPSNDSGVRVEAPGATSTTTSIDTTSTTGPTATTTTGNTTDTTSAAAHDSIGVFAGSWERHGIDLHITAAGNATMNWRTYRVCGQDAPPCDTWVGNVITDGGHATFRLQATGPQTAAGTVLTTSDASTLPLGPINATLGEKGDLVYLVPFPGANMPFCGPRANDPRCGA